MLISDWSSDVCSSDLSDPFRQVRTRMGRRNACLQGPPYESPEMRRSLTIGRHCQKHASTKNPVQTLIPATSGGRALILPSNFLSNTFSLFSICSNLLFFRFSCEETTMGVQIEAMDGGRLKVTGDVESLLNLPGDRKSTRLNYSN